MTPNDAPTSTNLQIGWSMRVDASLGSASVVPLTGGFEPGTPVAVSGNVQQFGPYEDLAAFRVICTGGTIETTVNTTTTAQPRPYRRTIGAGRTTSVRVAAKSDLMVTGSAGYVYDAATLTPIYTAPVTIPATDYPRLMIVVCTLGTLDIETAWVALPQGWLGLNGMVVGLNGLAIGLAA